MNAVANQELSIRASHLEQHMTMRVRMADERTVHVEQRDPAEMAMCDTQSGRHSSLQSGIGLTGIEPLPNFVANDRAPGFIENDREDEAENRDDQQADTASIVRPCQAVQIMKPMLSLTQPFRRSRPGSSPALFQP
jgi:hypothetical protein